MDHCVNSHRNSTDQANRLHRKDIHFCFWQTTLLYIVVELAGGGSTISGNIISIFFVACFQLISFFFLLSEGDKYSYIFLSPINLSSESIMPKKEYKNFCIQIKFIEILLIIYYIIFFLRNIIWKSIMSKV